jgi:hypothetical protein
VTATQRKRVIVHYPDGGSFPIDRRYAPRWVRIDAFGEFVSHRRMEHGSPSDTEWSVTCPETGCRVGASMLTRELAIAEARRVLRKQGKKNLRAARQRWLKHRAEKAA